MLPRQAVMSSKIVARILNIVAERCLQPVQFSGGFSFL
jgi:hypothetical protein